MKVISVEELKSRIDRGENPVIIDIRETYEFEESNIGGHNLPMGEIGTWMDDFKDRMSDEIIVCCNTGNRSQLAVSFLENAGFSNVKNLSEGVVGWKSRFGD